MVVDKEIVYSDIFHEDVEKQTLAVVLFKHLWDVRKSLLEVEWEINTEKSPGDPDCDLLMRYVSCLIGINYYY